MPIVNEPQTNNERLLEAARGVANSFHAVRSDANGLVEWSVSASAMKLLMMAISSIDPEWRVDPLEVPLLPEPHIVGTRLAVVLGRDVEMDAVLIEVGDDAHLFELDRWPWLEQLPLNHTLMVEDSLRPIRPSGLRDG